MHVDNASSGLQIAHMKDNNPSFTFLKSLIPTLIVAASILTGLLGGAKVISNGVVEANRFQVIDSETLFDSATGGLFIMTVTGWEHYLRGYQSGPRRISSPYDWVEYLEETKWELKDARKDL